MNALKIKELRLSLNMSQANFADSIGVSHTSMSAYELGKKKPPLETLIKIADTYKVSLDWLCDREDKNSEEVKNEKDALKRLIEISKASEIKIEIDKEDFEHIPLAPWEEGVATCSGKIKIESDLLPKFLNKWSDILTVYNNGTINEDLYSLWCDNEIKQFGEENNG